MKERDFGDATGQPWSSGIGDLIDTDNINGLETWEQLTARMRKVLDWFNKVPETHILAVGHGTAEAVLYAVYRQKPYAAFLGDKELRNGMIREYVLQ